MPKVFPEVERNMVKQLSKEGMNNVVIAAKMAELYPVNWNNKSGARAAARILQNDSGAKVPAKEDGVRTLDEMSREERFRYIRDRLETTPRFRMVFDGFSDAEKEVFTDEYLTIIRSTDSLTEVEEQALFSSILELILSFQALRRKQSEEKMYEDSMAGKIPEDSPKFRRFVDDKYQKEYDQHAKLHQQGIKNLKMSREQRLKEVKSERRTLVDLAEELSTKTVQAEVATNIEQLSKIRDEELKKMLEEGHLFGIFGVVQ
jgi:hypothetical protein